MRENFSWEEGVSEREWSEVCAECVRENYSLDEGESERELKLG